MKSSHGLILSPQSVLIAARGDLSTLIEPVQLGQADVVGNAVLVAKIATGELEDVTTEDGRNTPSLATGWGLLFCASQAL